jgi:hypothetical protein
MGRGKEAMTVRHLFLVLVLVGAAFLGGAFVNGPGLQWAQARLLRSLGLNNGGEIASIELKPATSSEPEIKPRPDGFIPVDPRADVAKGPIAPIPSLQAETESPKQDAPDQPPSLQSPVKSSVDSSTSPALHPPSVFLDKRIDSKSGNHTPSSSDRRVTPAGSTTPHSPAGPPSSPVAGETAPAILDSLAALLPVDLPTPTSALPPSSPSEVSNSKAPVNGTDSWVVLERKMQSLGVARYTMDGEPGGRVVFSCSIPLAGHQAVTQRFEAEGDDIIHAAQATLRRIALWRASQPPSP